MDTSSTEKILTYEDYMAEDVIYAQYDIIDGRRIYRTSPSVATEFYSESARQRLPSLIGPNFAVTNLMIQSDMAITRGQEEAILIAIDVLSHARPRQTRMANLRSHFIAGTIECWLISPQAETVEVLRLTHIAHETVKIYSHDQTVTSISFPDLSIKVADIFAFDE
jgi:hypothetical protein